MQPESTPAIAPEALEKKRSRRLLLLGVACLLAALAYGIYWLLVARYKVDTDNAYVQGNVVQITPQVGGTIIAIDADDTDSVKLGQTLVRLDTKDARVALEQAEAQLGLTVREVRATFANNKALLATVDARAATLARSQSELNRLSADLARRTPLVSSGAVSKEEVQHLQTAVANARSEQVAAQASLAEAREQLARNQTLTDGTSVENHPRVLAAA
ncbi:MAG: biotin/lipoyl-binding protein, partial [Candidatus Dechloromonas phosphoritropha]